MNNEISKKVLDQINSMLLDGYDFQSIKDAFDDGAWLATQSFSQLEVEDADFYLSSKINELNNQKKEGNKMKTDE